MVTILIVDDSAFMRKIIKNVLAKAGHTEIIEAENGEKALKLFKEKKPTLIILDIIMPDMSGIDALRQMMKIDSQAKVVMVTAVGQEQMVDECKGLGACGYIVKPFDNKKIMAEVEKVLG